MDVFVRFLSPSLMILLGLWVGAFVVRRLGAPWRAIWLGALTFVGSQVLHIPFNAYVLNPLLERLGWVLYAGPGTAALLMAGLAFGLSAGVFEEVARYVVYRFWLKGGRRWADGLGFGAGHGGVEALLLGVLGILTVVQIIGLQDVDLAARMSPEELVLAEAQIEAFWAAPWYLILLGFLERAFAISFHLAASLLVLQAFRRRNGLWLLAAIAWHTILDAAAVFGLRTWGALPTEAVLGVIALASLVIVWRLRDAPEGPASPEVPSELLELGPAEITKEQLEESRYG